MGSFSLIWKEIAKLPSLLIFWEVLSSTVLGFPDGKFSMVCESMLPVHENAVPQTSPAPYAISVSSTSFNPGDAITVSLTAMNGSSFKGFFLQAREVGGSVAVGSFQIINPNTQSLTCNKVQNSSLSHVNKENKQNVSAIWVAPSDVGHIVFSNGTPEFYSILAKGSEPNPCVFQPTIGFSFTNLSSEHLCNKGYMLPAHMEKEDNEVLFPGHKVEKEDMSWKKRTYGQPLSHSIQVYFLHVKRQIPTEEGHETEKFIFSIPDGCTPQDPDCCFMSSQAVGKDAFKFEMSGFSDGYIAIGFSDDTIMGNDDNYICGMNAAGHIEVQHAFSIGRFTPEIKPLGKVEILATSFNNGIIKCSFISRNAISTQSRAVNSLYYIFLTTGPSSAGRIRKHPRKPFITNQKVNISSFGTISGSSSTPLIIKAHGALMLVAWMTKGSVGMILARYLKKSVKQTLFGKEIWFQMHLFQMSFTVLATIIAFILVFVSVNGWSSSAGAHAIIGCIVIILSVLQPVIAFFRPSPQNNRRFIFNWFHMLNALVIKLLAVVAIFLGLQLLSNSPNHWMIKTMGGFVGWEALTAITLDVNLWLQKKELHLESQNMVKNELLLLLIYLCGNLAFLIALLIGIGRY